MSAVWITVVVLAIGTSAAKAAGTLVLGGRDLSPRALNVTALVAPAILAGLVVYETVAAHNGSGITLDARAAGLGAAIVAILAKAPMLVVILVAAAVTAGVRAFS